MRAAEFIVERKKRKRPRWAAYGPGPYGGYGYYAGYSGDSGEGGDGGGGESVEHENFVNSAQAYRAHLIKTLPQIMKLFANVGKGWIPSKEQMLSAVDNAYQVMKHTGDAKQAGKALMDELNTLHRMSQGKQGMAEAYPKQQAARYNPNGTTYKGSANKMPTLDPNDPAHNADRYGTAYDEPYEMDFDKEDLKRAIAKGMSDLSDREKQILKLRFWEDMTYEEVASELGVTRERIRQIEARALRQLKHPTRSDRLRPFVYPEIKG